MQQGGEKCRCETVLDSLAVVEWSDEPCPFLPNRCFRQSKERPCEILEGLACACGKEMGERIFSSDRAIGSWRLHSYRHVCWELKAANQQFENCMAEKIGAGLHLLKILEGGETEAHLEGVGLSNSSSGIKTKKRGHSASSRK